MATSGGGGRRVLLVEEHPDGRDMLRFALEHAGYRSTLPTMKRPGFSRRRRTRPR